MKKVLVSMILCLGIVIGAPTAAYALEMDAQAAILIDATTGRVLYEHNAYEHLAPASTTKILTALMVLESVDDISQTITLPDDYVNVGESGITLDPGETVVIEDLLYALMLQSANDAAQALAIAVSGDEPTFIEEMNSYIADMGLTDSNWENPHGLDGVNHYSTAYDLARITQRALFNPTFVEVINTDSWTMPWPGSDTDRIFYNHNKFLSSYSGADGVKTGYTNLAGNCLVASVTRDGMQLIGVVLNCPNQTHYQQMTLLMDYGFANYVPLKLADMEDALGNVKIKRGDVGQMGVTLAKDIVISMPSESDYIPELKVDLPRRVIAPLQTDDPVGMISFSDEAGNEAQVPIYLQESVAEYTYFLVVKDVWQSFVQVFF